jgi:predicted DNA-binding protein
MVETLEHPRRSTTTITFRLPVEWHDSIDYLRELQGLSMSEQLRELLQVGGEQIGLDLD